MPVEGNKESGTQDRFPEKLSKALFDASNSDDFVKVADGEKAWFDLLYPLVKENDSANEAQTEGVEAVEKYQAEIKSKLIRSLKQAMEDQEVKDVIASSKTGQVSDEVRPAVIDLGVGGVKLAISPGPAKGQLTIEIAENSPPDKIQRWEKMKRGN